MAQQSSDTGLRSVAQMSARISYVFMCLTLCWGVLTATGWVRNLTGRKALRGGHMVMATLTLAFGVVHAASFYFLSVGAFSIARLTVPFLPSGLARHAFGIIGLELMIAIAITAGMHRFIAYRRWLWLHRLAYLAIPLLAVHSFFGAIANGHLAVLWLGGITLLVPVVTLSVLRFLPSRALERIGLVEELI
ncbi:ferric reductase-like transmembrane domain-containing protein [Amycolatopsis sp. GM8]|uniref:ferric reductase-like transmembrane domain-containing protein n=1 Tax=Amycolatopsis sp. GM8 TaxID=2896530 RepID=UPI002104591D